MKKIYAVIAASLLAFSGCNVLDTKDLSNYGPDVWNDSKLTSAFLTDIYGNVLNLTWPRDGGNSDECLGIMGKDAVQPNNSSFKFWPYTSIRNINTLLKNVDEGTLPESEKNLMKGQAYFMRAFQYFKMVRLHGGVPIIKEPQSLEDDLNVKRNSTAECFEFILSDLDEAAKLLPVKNSGDSYGRIDQCIVAAFKSRVLLYKASPQFNPSSPYNNSYWKDAYNAAKSAKELLDQNGYGLVDNYTDVFETKKHSEAILPIIYSNPTKVNGRAEDAVRPLSESKNATGGDQPTWGLVESFPMKDGKKAGESDKYSYNVQEFWKNRDPRFDAVIVYNGGIYELSGKAGRRQYTTPNIANSLDAFGYNIQGEHHNRTGLYCKKGIMEELPVAQVTLNDVDWLEIRYPEIMFNLAETANENGSTAEGYETLVAIRKRAGIEPGVNNLYGLKAGMSREEMRLALLDEKRIEFCFEGQRFWDLRRHRMLHTYLNGQHKYGILANVKAGIDMTDAMNRAASYTLMPEEFDYQVIDLIFQNPTGEDAMYMPESYYFFPISKDEIEKNPNLDQNKDWGGSFDPVL
ncbi:RagB/SusD family nutrient uptake outer membrane protein [Parabacteroides sp. BX2]|jgi:starch-binding outer membrane protein, SusD/RagB family|uniref:RagB/SusD family nutrient uptake outer membrane protein n=1 Tax=Parabacteroides segnis TaxID=2763058 RepID=A0ABR7E571_9BACT|nr:MULTISPECIES: RagB/SusD family nutrient uptake outer membrane protein [Parabacteroides]MBC5644496.1 RagB/SusD family nutrient uptake outer membrane protein [Parabacteroides segnis]MCM0714429.1 RagB/SusD family nutrient uptake outer membrane protein [Parabacteroides sp. TA-V-105]